MDFIRLTAVFTAIQFVRYILFAGVTYIVFWKLKNNFTEKNRIQKNNFAKKDLRREFLYSVSNCFIFGFILAISFYDRQIDIFNLKMTASYLESIGWIIFLILFHDTYFYWMHKTLHHPKMFNWTHKVHHLSKNPSPFAALSFHPLEGVLEVIWIIPISRIFPIEMGAWAIFGFIIIGINVLGHLGVEIYPGSWTKNKFLKYLNTSTNHNDHHNYYHGNYSLYFSAWDRWMGTFRK